MANRGDGALECLRRGYDIFVKTRTISAVTLSLLETWVGGRFEVRIPFL